MKKSFFLLLAVATTLVSCKKDLIEKAGQNQNNSTATSFKEIKTNAEFNWSTKQDVELSIAGLQTVTPITNTLKISSADGKTIYNSLFYSMETSSKVKVTVPIIVKELRVDYGSISKLVKIESGKADFNFIPVITDQGAE
ncbi:MAG: hypothetical protein LCH37_03105 [Bacteroidetes bacterium]|nr:hypothetical protein [Bacteroidota bacterium]